jgi:hypothetical protein
MITKFKIFENSQEPWDHMKGSYVILGKLDKKYSDFLEKNIALITKVYYPGAWFNVIFDNIPKELEKSLDNLDFNTADIKHISKNKEDLESILKSKKYNI